MKSLFVILATLILTLAISPSRAVASGVLALDGQNAAAVATVTGHMQSLMDPGGQMSLGDVLGADAPGWTDIPGDQPDFGYTRDFIWLRLSVRNDTADTSDWVVHFHENFKQILDTWIVYSDGRAINVLSLTQATPFTERPLAFPQMAAPFNLEPGQEAEIYIRFWSEGSSILPVSIKTRQAFLEDSALLAARNFIFYGLIAAFIAAALIGALVFSSITAVSFAAYASFVLLFVMHSDGTAFQYLYPHLPGFNSIASVVWGGGFIFFSVLYSRIFLGTSREFPVLDKLLVGVMVVVAVLAFSMFFVDRQLIKKAFVVVALFGLLVNLTSGFVVARYHFREVRFFLLAWTGAVLSSLLMNMIHIFGIELAQDVQTNSMRVVMVIDAAMMGLAILDRYKQVRDRGQAALNASLDAAQRNLQLSRRLSEVERQVNLLDGVSRQKDEAFANAIHDLRQPLHALRLRVRTEAAGETSGQTEQAKTNASFDYLETLISGFLDDYHQKDNSTPPEPLPDAAHDDTDDLTLGAVLDGAYGMFLPDAAEKGLELRLVPTTLRTTAPPLAVMRIVTNLLANAIKYTPRGKVLLGCRRRGGMVSVELHDTGPGLSGDEFTQALRRDARLHRTTNGQTGEGFGLAIADELARAHGGRILRLPGRKHGLSLAVLLPRAEPDRNRDQNRRRR